MKSVHENFLLEKQKQKKSTENHNLKKNRFLITENILGSAGPIRFVVSEEENVAAVIDTALKMYAREGRLPILGSGISNFLLYPVNAGSNGIESYSCLFFDVFFYFMFNPFEDFLFCMYLYLFFE